MISVIQGKIDQGLVVKIRCKVEKILKGSLDSILSPSVKTQNMGGKFCLSRIQKFVDNT